MSIWISFVSIIMIFTASYYGGLRSGRNMVMGPSEDVCLPGDALEVGWVLIMCSMLCWIRS